MNTRLLSMARELERHLARQRPATEPAEMDARMSRAEALAARATLLSRRGENFTVDCREMVIRFKDGREERFP